MNCMFDILECLKELSEDGKVPHALAQELVLKAHQLGKRKAKIELQQNSLSDFEPSEKSA